MTQHAIERAKERLGIDVTLDDLAAAVASLGKSPRAVLVARQAGGRQMWMVPLKGVMAGIVVQVRDGAVLTVMTTEQTTRPGIRGEFNSKSVRAQKRRGAWKRRWSREPRMGKPYTGDAGA